MEPGEGGRRQTRRRVIPYKEEPETLGHRIAAGVVSALAMLFTVVLLPVVVATLAEGGDLHDLHAEYGPARIWFALLAGGAFVLGAVLGPRRSAHFFGYLWGTEEPQRPWLTVALWAAIAVMLNIGFKLSS